MGSKISTHFLLLVVLLAVLRFGVMPSRSLSLLSALNRDNWSSLRELIISLLCGGTFTLFNFHYVFFRTFFLRGPSPLGINFITFSEWADVPEDNNKDGDESNDVIEPWVDVFDFIGWFIQFLCLEKSVIKLFNNECCSTCVEFVLFDEANDAAFRIFILRPI